MSDMPRLTKLWKEAREEACTHFRIRPKFDEMASIGLSPAEVRKRWPRGYGECPDCGVSVIWYASYMHYIAGDW